MGIWEDEWMQFINGLDQKEENETVLRNFNYYRNLNRAETEAFPAPRPPGLYPFSSQLTVLNLYSGQQAVLFLCPTASCQLLTTLYIYTSQYSLFALLFLLLGYLALVVLAMLACRHSYNYCFANGKCGKGGGSRSAAARNGERGRCPHCDGQRDIIIQVNQNRMPSPPPAVVNLPPPQNDGNAPKLVIAQMPNSDEKHQQQQALENFKHQSVMVVDNVKDTADNVEQLAMHLAAHLVSVDSLFERKEYRLLQDGKKVSPFENSSNSAAKVSSQSSNEGDSRSSIYLSDLLQPTSISLSTTTSSISMSTPLSLKHEAEHQFANELEKLKTIDKKHVEGTEQFKLSTFPAPSASQEVPHCMMINRFAHKISQTGEEGIEGESKKGVEQV